MAVRRGQSRGERPPLDAAALERFALRYVERYATTRRRLARYLARKLHERGWADHGEPDIKTLIGRLAALGYVDDAAFALSRSETLGRRGLGERRVAADLRAAGIADNDSEEARAAAAGRAFEAALRYAQKRRIGPFAADKPDRADREKAMSAMLRAGHSIEIARRFVNAEPGDEIVPTDT